MTDDIVKSLGYLALGTRLKRIGDRLQQDTQAILAEEGVVLSASLYPFLAAIEQLGEPTVGDLAAAIGVSQPAATKSLGQLVKSGHVRIAAADGDLRRRLAILTDEGLAAVASARERIWPRVAAAVADLCDGLDGPLLDQIAAMEEGLAARPLTARRARKKDKDA